MSDVVVDACVVLALVLREDRAEDVSRQLGEWAAAGTALHAPALAHYEIASGLTRSRAEGRLEAEDVAEAWAIVDGLGLVLHEPAGGERVVEIACDLERRSAYDAAYLALGERLGMDVWTLDGPLLRNAGGRREYRVRAIEVAQPIGEHDVVELLEAVAKVDGAGSWPAGTIGTVVSERGESKLVEIAEDRPPGQTLDLISVAGARLKLVDQRGA